MKLGLHLPSCGGGLVYPSSVANIDAMLELTRLAERGGFDSVWANDHVSDPFYDDPNRELPGFYESMPLLSYLAAFTSRMKLGVAVMILPLRDPVWLARMTATLDVISKGRVILGVGVGRFQQEFSALGVPFEKRGAMLDEGIQVIKSVWSGSPASFNGKFYRFNDLSCGPKPLQNPCPLWIGGNIEAAIKRAARWGDGWVPGMLPPEQLKANVEKIADRAKKYGRDPQSIEIADEILVSVSKSEQKAWENFKQFPYVKRIAYAESLELTSLVGTPQQIIDKLKSYKAAGLQHAVLVFTNHDRSGLSDAVALFANDVIAKL